MEAEKQDQLLLSQAINHSCNLLDFRPRFHGTTAKAEEEAQRNLARLHACYSRADSTIGAIYCSSTPEPPGLQGRVIAQAPDCF